MAGGTGTTWRAAAGGLVVAWLLAAAVPAAGGSPAAAAVPSPEVRESTIPVAGGSLHSTVRGQGEPVLVLSGGPGFSSDYMAPVAAELSSSYRTVLPDQRGTGRSRLEKLDETSLTVELAVADLERLRRELGIGSWIVLGHSWGGMLSMLYLAAHPEAVRAVVLVGSGGPTRDFFELFGNNLEARLLPADREAIEFWRDPAQRQADPQRATYESLRAKAPAYFFERKKAWSFVALMRPEGYTAAVNRLLLTDLERTGYDLRPALRRAHLPALILQGRQDPMPESVAIELHGLLEGSQLRFFDRCGHFPWIEQPEAFYAAVRDFLATAGAAAAPRR